MELAFLSLYAGPYELFSWADASAFAFFWEAG
jgi:hypothetical protein